MAAGLLSFIYLFFFFGNPIVWVAMSHQLPQIVLRVFNPVLTLRTNNLTMQAMTPCPAPTHCWWMRSVQATSLLAVVVRHIVGFFFYSFPFMLPSEIPKLPVDTPVRGFSIVQKLLLHYSLPRMSLHPSIFCLCFHLFYFTLPPFEEIGLPYQVPGVLHQCSAVVLWKLLNYLLMNLQGIKWSPCPIPLPSWYCPFTLQILNFSKRTLSLPFFIQMRELSIKDC